MALADLEEPDYGPAFFGYTNTTSGRRSGHRLDKARHGNSRRGPKQLHEFEKGDIVEGVVRHVNHIGVFIDIGAVTDALLPREKTEGMPHNVGDYLEDLMITELDSQQLRWTVMPLGCVGYIYYIGEPGQSGGGEPMGFADPGGLGPRRPLTDFHVDELVPGIARRVMRDFIFVDVGAVTDGLLYKESIPEGLAIQNGDRIDDLYIQRLDAKREHISLGILEKSVGAPLAVRKGKGKGKGKGTERPGGPSQRVGRPLEDFRRHEQVSGVVAAVKDFGIFFDIGAVTHALLGERHVPKDTVYKRGDEVDDLLILNVNPERNQISLGMVSTHSNQMRPSIPRGESASTRTRSRSSSAYDRGYSESDLIDNSYGHRSSFSGKGGGIRSTGKLLRESYTSQESAAASYADASSGAGTSKGPALIDYLDGESFPDASDPILGDPRFCWDKPLKERAKLPKRGRSLQARAEPGTDGATDDQQDQNYLAPEIRNWLDTKQVPPEGGDHGTVGDGHLPGAADSRNVSVHDGDDPMDDEAVVEFLRGLTPGDLVDGTVTWTTEQGAHVRFGPVAVEGVLPLRLIDWPVRVGDEVGNLIISRVDVEGRRVTLGVDPSEVDAEKVETPARPSGAAAAKGSGRGGAGGRGRGGRGQGRGVGGEDADREDGGGRALASGRARGSGLHAEDGLQEVEGEMLPLLDKIYAGQRSAARELARAVAASRQPIQACFNASVSLKFLMGFNNCATAALMGIQELNEKLGSASEPLLVRIIPAVLEKYGDPHRSVRVAAEDAAETIIARLNPYGVESVLPAVLNAFQRRERTDIKVGSQTNIKVGALRLLALMRDEETLRPLARNLDKIIPHVVDQLNDVNKDLRAVARETAMVLFECAQNRDLEPYLESIIMALKSQEHIPACVSQLSEIVFVQPIETQALAVMMPLIKRGLKDKNERTKRKALTIADNMCKLVPDVSEIHPFLDDLIPLVKKAKDHISDREVCGVADRCLQTLHDAGKAGGKKVIDKSAIDKILSDRIPEEKGDAVTKHIRDYLASLCRSMSLCRTFEHAEWWQCIAPYLMPHILTKAQCEELVLALLESCYDAAEGDDVEDEEEEGHDLCNCVFSLGYGSLTLLNNTRLHLKRGRCYGLCGPNDCGKSTVLRAINNEQVDGFPPKTELVTAFVEHGIGEKEPECEWTPLEYMFADETIQAMQISKKKVVAALRSLGFDTHQLKSEIGHLSGGWKMKLGLVRAMLMCADILLLDEPTGHLDVDNASWLGEYILGLRNDSTRPVTTIVVSHDTAFLDRVCTHIISIRKRKLKTYRGNFTEFLRRQPDARSYLSLNRAKLRFVLPEPGPLEGVRSRGKRLLRMHNVSFTYPDNEEPTLCGVSLEVSMLSRVAVIGPNGSGKSTLIKALVGELPINHSSNNSSIWKHPNVRISYVAQHAFHHIEQHLDKTATQYMLWRFTAGEDREALSFRAEEVGRQRRLYFFKDGQLARVADDRDRSKAVEPEQILGRRRARRSAGAEEEYEYNVKWRGLDLEFSTWVSRDKLLDMGVLTMLQREDEKQAAVQGILARPLTQPHVEEHLAGFGLEASFASHTRIGVLSGGQKVKVVLGAATWLSPHILILDEPTNYLDRDSLAALAVALKDFGGGVIIVSHNREFYQNVCGERWLMDKGRLSREGEEEKADVLIERGATMDEYIDEVGNVHQIEQKTRTDRDIKRQKRQKELRRKRGEKVSSDEEF